MPEIVINPKDAEALLHVLGDASIEFDNEGHLISKSVIDEIRDQIREQVKPAVSEPLDFGSIIRATAGDVKNELWQQAHDIGKHYWRTENDVVEVWSELTDVEVLRVGLGVADENKLQAAFADGLHEGKREMNTQVHAHLVGQLGAAIGAERKNAIERAIAMVEELAP